MVARPSQVAGKEATAVKPRFATPHPTGTLQGPIIDAVRAMHLERNGTPTLRQVIPSASHAFRLRVLYASPDNFTLF
jgi:hypothetical protein